MIKQTFGILREPFFSSCDTLFPQQQEILNLISIHAHHGGFNLIYGEPGVGKTVIREHIEGFDTERENVVVSISRTMHTYNQIILQMAEAMKIEASKTKLEKALITAAYNVENGNKKLFVVIDEAHLLHTDVLRKLRLLLEHFPRRHTLVLFGQSGLLHTIALKHNLDLKTRVTYSSHLKPLNDETMQQYILSELEKSQLGVNSQFPIKENQQSQPNYHHRSLLTL